MKQPPYQIFLIIYLIITPEVDCLHWAFLLLLTVWPEGSRHSALPLLTFNCGTGDDGTCRDLLLRASHQLICVKHSLSFIDFQILLCWGPLYLAYWFKNTRLGFRFIIIILAFLIEPKCYGLGTDRLPSRQNILVKRRNSRPGSQKSSNFYSKFCQLWGWGKNPVNCYGLLTPLCGNGEKTIFLAKLTGLLRELA